MAETFDSGHREMEKDLPRPLQSGWYPGIWALPATTISTASLLVLMAVFGFLQINEVSRTLFRLPWSSGLTATAAALIAWGIAARCRHRPGRHWPRWWVLSLALLASGVAMVGLLGKDLGKHPQVHALALASLVASVTLLPRLVRLHPAHWLVQHIAPAGLATVLLVALPASVAFGRHAVEDRKLRIAETIAELEREAGEVREVSSFDWSTSFQRRQEALQQANRLQNLPLEQWVADRFLWEGALILGDDERLAAAHRELLDAVVEGIDPARTPKLWHPEFTWNRDGKIWERDPVFADLSAGVAGYHWRNAQILRLLEPPAGEGESLRQIQAYYSQKQEEAGERLAAFTHSWAQEWVLPLAQGPEAELTASPMAELLQRPLLRDGTLRAVSFEDLLDLRLGEARRTADPAQGCGNREYEEDDISYFRIDCYAYSARLDPRPAAVLRVEMRVVYKAEEKLEPLSHRDLPAEVFLLFPVPPSVDAASYRLDVMSALESAVGDEHDGVTLDKIDRSGSPAKGFSFETRAGRRIRAVSHQIDDLSDGVAGIQVRVYYLDRSF